MVVIIFLRNFVRLLIYVMDNFIVSARKYRPATFETVVGQLHITATLQNAISRGQLAHAYLFCGPRGVGKTTCARIFAKTINCQSPTNNEACGECESCRSFGEGRSFNIHELDAASNNSVDDIRTLTDQVRIPPQIGQYSVYIIDEVHMLSSQAFNAFLKTLEEPPAHAIFILATTEKHKIIPTILSRCQIYDFNRIRVEDSVGYLKSIALKECVEYDEESLHLIAQKADGGMRDALSMLDKAVSFCGNRLNFHDVAATLNVLDYDTYFNITSLIGASDYQQTLVMFDNVLKRGFSGQTFVAGLNTHFRDLLMCKDPQTLPLLEITGSLLEKYRQQSTLCEISFLFGAIALLSTIDASFKTTTNQRLHVELGLMKLCGLGQKKNDFEPKPATLPNVEVAVKQVITPVVQPPIPTTFPQPQVKAEVEVQVQPQPETQASPQPQVKEQAQTEMKPQSQTQTQVESVMQPQTEIEKNLSASTETEQQSQVQPQAELEQPPKSIENQEQTPPPKSIFGGSIRDILSHQTQEEEDQIVKDEFDSQCKEKVERNKVLFLRELQAKRPRMTPAFRGMQIEGHTISITVYTETIREEILRNSQELVELLQQCCGITGIVKFDILVSLEQNEALPIKAEDKYKYLVDKNPEIVTLVKELGLEIN